jgi:transcriptional regulator GlxA family with amidase domain
MRIEHAKQLLLSTDLGNVQIAMECGFSSVSTFHQVFLATVGQPPMQYRRQRRG